MQIQETEQRTHRKSGETKSGKTDADSRDRDSVGLLQEIMGQMDGAEINRRRGARFRYRLYLTKTMAETNIEALELSVRSYNSLKRAGYGTIGQLAEDIAAGTSLSHIRNCGKKSAEEIMVKLFAYQYAFLKPEKRERYLLETVALNLTGREDT